MEQDAWLKAEWGLTDTRRKARFYAITPAGRKQLAEEERNWADVADGVARVLRFAKLEQELATHRARREEEELREDHQLGKSRLTERGSLTAGIYRRSSQVSAVRSWPKL